MPIKFILTSSQAREIKQAPELIKDIKGANIPADQTFDSDEFISQIGAQEWVPVILPRSNRKRVGWLIIIYTKKDILLNIFSVK